MKNYSLLHQTFTQYGFAIYTISNFYVNKQAITDAIVLENIICNAYGVHCLNSYITTSSMFNVHCTYSL